MKKIFVMFTLLLVSNVLSFSQITIKPTVKPTIKPSIKTTNKPTIKPSVIQTYTLIVNSNARPFTLFIDGKKANGNRVALQEGNHTILVQADGYTDYITNIDIHQNLVINATLNFKRQVSYVTIEIPNNMINNSFYNALNQIRIFDNGRLMNGFNFEVAPGSHTIRIESGGFAVEGFYNFINGKSYTIKPMLYLNIE